MRDEDLLSAEAVRDPYPVFRRMRESDPVHWSDRYNSWFLTRHDDVAAAFRDDRFSSDRISGFIEAKLGDPDVDGDLRATFDVLARWLVFKDPPEHTRLRRLVHSAFTPRAVERMRVRAREVAHELLDEVAVDGRADLVSAYAFPIPAIVIAEMLGVPAEDRDQFKLWSDQLSSLVFGNFDDTDRYADAAGGMRELTGYLDRLVEAARHDPQDDLIGALVRARDEGDALTHDEVIATCTLLLFGGHETTTNLIANALHLLVQHPPQLAEVRAGRHDMRDVVEETLRFDGPAKTVVRELAADVELRGRTLERGSRVFLVPAAANRDPAVFDRPDDFLVGRGGGNHLGFGLGIHYCLGAPLARLEAAEAISVVVERLSDLQLATAEVTWQPVLLNRGPTSLPVTFTAVDR